MTFGFCREGPAGILGKRNNTRNRLLAILERSGAVIGGPSAGGGEGGASPTMQQRTKQTPMSMLGPAKPKVASISSVVEEEKKKFANLPKSVVSDSQSEHGFDKLKFFATQKDSLPIHYSMHRVIDSALPTEANTERVFSFAKRILSDDRQSTSSEHLQALVSVACLWKYFKPSLEAIRKEYNSLLKAESASKKG